MKKNILLLALILSFLIFLTTPAPIYSKSNQAIRPKIALALGGGGARGAAYIGVLRVLEKENIPIDYLIGTSVGSLIAVLYSGGVSLDDMEMEICNGTFKKLYRTDVSFFSLLSAYLNEKVQTFLHKPYHAGLYNDHKLHDYVNRVISMDNGAIELSIPLNIIAVDLVTGLPIVIDSRDVGLAVEASTAIPVLRQPIPFDGHLLVDGAVLKNIPVEEARKMGADIVIAVDLDAKLEAMPIEDFKTLATIIMRVIYLGIKAHTVPVLGKADIVISPDLNEIKLLDLSGENLSNAVRIGEEETLKMIPEIKKKIQQKTFAIKK